jgi:hypothetical protein
MAGVAPSVVRIHAYITRAHTVRVFTTPEDAHTFFL